MLQQVRGGQTRLAHITAPQSDFGGDGSKTDALHAMELALSFEKLNFQKLKELQAIAEKNSDAQMSDFVEAMLQEQVRCSVPCQLLPIPDRCKVAICYVSADVHLYSVQMSSTLLQFSALPLVAEF